MKTHLRVLLLGVLLGGSLALADTVLKDEGVTVGPTRQIDCKGTGIACTRTGSTAELTVSGTATGLVCTECVQGTDIQDGEVTDDKLSSSYSGTGACSTGTAAVTLNDNAAPTCRRFLDEVTDDGSLVWAAGNFNSIDFGDGISCTADALNLSYDCELNHEESWNAPTLLNSWTNFGTGANGQNQVAGYYKAGNRVYLRGLVQGGTVSTSSTGNIFVLPAGYRPTLIEMYLIITNGSAGPGRLDIHPTGDVRLVNGSNTVVSLAGISFRTD